MKIIYKFSAVFFMSSVAYGLISYNFFENKEVLKVLYDPTPKSFSKDELAEKYVEKLFKEEGSSVQKKEDIELAIDYLRSKLKKHEENIIAEKKIDNKNAYETASNKLDNVLKNSINTKQTYVDGTVSKERIIRNEEKLAKHNDLKKTTINMKIENANLGKNNIYEFSKNEKKIDQKVINSKSQKQGKESDVVLISGSPNKNQEKDRNFNKYYEANTKIDLASNEKNKFKEKVQQIEMVRLERNKKLSEEF